MLRRIIFVFFTIPVAIALIALAVANRASVPISLDVINPGNPTMTWSAPMFVWHFAAMAVGVLLRAAFAALNEIAEAEDTKKKAEREGAPSSSLVMSS